MDGCRTQSAIKIFRLSTFSQRIRVCVRLLGSHPISSNSSMPKSRRCMAISPPHCSSTRFVAQTANSRGLHRNNQRHPSSLYSQRIYEDSCGIVRHQKYFTPSRQEKGTISSYRERPFINKAKKKMVSVSFTKTSSNILSAFFQMSVFPFLVGYTMPQSLADAHCLNALQ